jgi:phage recombination protein Bet
MSTAELPSLLSAPIQHSPILFKQEQVDLIRRTICKDATTDEMQLFIQQCERTRLDPFTRQIYFIKDKKGKVNIMASIDGLRLIAERTGKYAGQTKTEWCGKDGKWTEIWLSDDAPFAARVGVHKTDFIEPLYAIAKFKAYASSPTEYWSTWNKMPDHMIAKVAESLALRKAFPNEMSGVYGEDEIKDAIINSAPKLSEITREPIIEDIIDTETGEVVQQPKPTLDAQDMLCSLDDRVTFMRKWEEKGFTRMQILNTIKDNCQAEGLTLPTLDKKFTHRLKARIDGILQEKIESANQESA